MTMLTPKQRKALAVLDANPRITASRFAQLYFDEPEHDYLHAAVSNQGNGACAGKKAWLCAGSLLGKLAKKGFVFADKRKSPTVFSLSEAGRVELQQNLTTI